MKKYHINDLEETVTIEIGSSLALVLSELLFRWSQTEDRYAVHLATSAEWHSLKAIGNQLDAQLWRENYHPDYLNRVQAAQKQIEERWGKFGDEPSTRL